MQRTMLSTEEVSAVTGIPTETLRYWRKRGTGPKSFRVGRRVYYTQADLDAWIESQRNGDRQAV